MYQKLYMGDANYMTSVHFNVANEGFILSTAQNYYTQKTSK